MGFIPGNRLSAGVSTSLTGQTLQFRGEGLVVPLCRHGLEILPDELVQALSQSGRHLAGTGNQTFIHRKSDIHLHILCVHIDRVKGRLPGFGANAVCRDKAGFVLHSRFGFAGLQNPPVGFRKLEFSPDREVSAS